MEDKVIENGGVVITDCVVEINEEPNCLLGVERYPYGPTIPPIKLQGKTAEEQIHHFAVICKQIDMCNSNVN